MSGSKGIDDLFFVGGNPRLRRQHRTASEVSTRRLPYQLPERVPVRGGKPLQEVRAEIAARIERFVAQSPRWSGRALPVHADPGTGKTTAAAAAVKLHDVNARFVFGTKKLANEFADTQGFELVRARNRGNCMKSELVALLGERGFPVGKTACGTEDEPICEWRLRCRYFRQLDGQGSKVSTTEQIFNPLFLSGAELVVVDDGDVSRALVRRWHLSLEAIHKSVAQLAGRKRGPARNLAALLAHAVVEAPRTYLAGPEAWDHLAKVAAREGYCLAELIEALPKGGTLLSPYGDQGELTVETVLAVPPANLAMVFAALREEIPAFLAGNDFNSRLRINTSGIEVAYLRDHPRDQEGYYIARSSMLVLDATPLPPLTALLTRHHALQPAVEGAVLLPEGVTVVQHARASNGHLSITSPAAVAAVKREIAHERARRPLPPEHEALISFMGSLASFADLGFLPEHILHFGSARGTNVLENVRRLHVVGRPFPPPGDLWYLAQVLHHDEEYVLQDLAVRPAGYAGKAWVVDIPDYVDPRMAELLRGFRENELWQVIHRARPTLLGTQPGRAELCIVLHTTQPIPGLPVTEFLPGKASRTVNDDRRDEAELSIRRAIQEISAMNEAVTERAIARNSRVSRTTLSKRTRQLGKVAHTPSEISPDNLSGDAGQHGKVAHTHIKEGSMGVYQVPMSSSPGSSLCRGGCGVAMPEGQSCVACATAAVEEWRGQTKRKGAR